MPRLDHIAYRTADRNKTAKFFQEAFGYEVGTEFDIEFDDGSTASCIALVPPERPILEDDDASASLMWTNYKDLYDDEGSIRLCPDVEYHMPPEIFVSDGPPGSIVGDWVAKRDGIGGIHHMAYQVDDVEATMKKWVEKGWAEFLTDEPLSCPTDDLKQVFSKPHPLTGVIYEFIKRGKHGFCKDNVKDLMVSTKDVDKEEIEHLKNLEMG